MLTALRAKFRLHEYRQVLLATADRLIVEDSPHDFEWGIRDREGGLGGRNLLGKALMIVRSELRESSVGPTNLRRETGPHNRISGPNRSEGRSAQFAYIHRSDRAADPRNPAALTRHARSAAGLLGSEQATPLQGAWMVRAPTEVNLGARLPFGGCRRRSTDTPLQDFLKVEGQSVELIPNRDFHCS